MAEREGFEPSVPLLAVHAISSRAPSASSDISPVFGPAASNERLWEIAIDIFPVQGSFQNNLMLATYW